MSKSMKVTVYLRVSTERQGRSGLGIEGQRVAVEAYVAQHSASIVRDSLKSRAVGTMRGRDLPRLWRSLVVRRRRCSWRSSTD